MVLGRDETAGLHYYLQIFPNVQGLIPLEHLDQHLGDHQGGLPVPWGILLGIRDPQLGILGQKGQERLVEPRGIWEVHPTTKKHQGEDSYNSFF